VAPGSPAKPRLHAQAVASLEPASAAALAPHEMQALASSATCCLLTVPAGHAVQFVWSSKALNVPTGHGLHVRLTLSSVKNPGGQRQSRISTPPSASRELFPTHATGTTDCTGQYVSTGHGAHASLLTWPLNDPVAQGAHANALKKKPGAHRHSFSATRVTAVVLMLIGHAVHVSLPSAGL